jgi:hypothetical protein
VRFLFTTAPRYGIVGYCRDCWLNYRHNWTEGESRAFWRPGDYRSKAYYTLVEKPARRRLAVKAVW